MTKQLTQAREGYIRARPEALAIHNATKRRH
jgi:hypothetical protein